MSLPILTTEEDVIKVVEYLRTKATGASIKDIKSALGSKVVDGRKISAYVTWGIVGEEGGKLTLTSFGRELARAQPERRNVSFQKILRNSRPYNGALEWIYHQNYDQVSTVEVASHWFENHKEEIGKANENTLRYMAVCFLNMCQAAGIGTLTIGRKGKPTRLDTHKEFLKAYIEEASPPPIHAEGQTEPLETDDELPSEETKLGESEDEGAPPEKTGAGAIFIAHGKNKKPLEHLKKVLDQFKIPYKVAIDEPYSGRPVSQKVSDLMHSCGSAIFLFTADEESKDSKNHENQAAPNSNVVFELGAASVLYGNRIIIFKEEGVEFSSDFSDLGYISFEKDNLGAKTTELLKELIELGFIRITST